MSEPKLTCEDMRPLLALYPYGELSFDEEESVDSHVERCAACQAEKQSLEQLHQALDEREIAPSLELLSQCRRAVRNEVAVLAEAGPGHGFWQRWRLPTLADLWKPAAACALLAVGFFTARLTPPAMPTDAPAARNVRFIEQGSDGRVRIVFDEVRRKEVAGRMDERNVSELMLSATTNQDDAGLRAESVEYLKSRCEREDVRSALLRALASDQNEAVRLRALDALKPYADHREVRAALRQVLVKDQSAALRTQAIDVLVGGKRQEPELAGTLQQLMSQEQNSYIRERSRTALRAMNASLETF